MSLAFNIVYQVRFPVMAPITCSHVLQKKSIMQVLAVNILMGISIVIIVFFNWKAMFLVSNFYCNNCLGMFFNRNQSTDTQSHAFGVKFPLLKMSVSGFSRNRKTGLKVVHFHVPITWTMFQFKQNVLISVACSDGRRFSWLESAKKSALVIKKP